MNAVPCRRTVFSFGVMLELGVAAGVGNGWLLSSFTATFLAVELAAALTETDCLLFLPRD